METDYAELLTLLENFSKEEIQAMILFLKGYSSLKTQPKAKKMIKPRKIMKSSNITPEMIEARILATKPDHEETEVEYRTRRDRVMRDMQEENGGWYGQYRHLL